MQAAPTEGKPAEKEAERAKKEKEARKTVKEMIAHETAREDMKSLVEGKMAGLRFLVDPIGKHRKYIQVWDVVVGCALVFTGLFTPWEVAFLPAYCPPHLLYLFNRLIDLLFFADMILQFFIVKFVNKGAVGMERVRTLPKTAKETQTNGHIVIFNG